MDGCFVFSQNQRKYKKNGWHAENVVSALLFGAAHLPAVAAKVGEFASRVAVLIVGANTVFGILFGYLFWRFGLEAAEITHASAHVASYVVSIFVA